MSQHEQIKIPVLDHGYVRFVEAFGHGDHDTPGELEAGIIEAARQSTQGSFRGWDTDYKLLKFLYENKHSTPFEFAGMVLEVRAPIFVFREWHRHRTQSYNEMSARYAPIPNLNYIPTVDRLMLGNDKNKQAGKADGSQELTRENALAFIARRESKNEEWQEEYDWALSVGIPKECARIGMPVGRYSQMRAFSVLRNWLGFLTLRLDPAAQWEIRQYAEAVAEIVSKQFPRTWSLYNN